ncbi:acetyl/propionyl/methylcrotonyl-CoA carboxylase subunit alpha [Bdellovibrio sp. NC01]|uniref:acetyl-CoA carboxylase biotin carboxylase subunit n=1 Tax=Bdellovibrio sp. NC01 TaxID=2220073 RepID=UPI00115BB355|nr:biotin carboxylase N-terminal domain-containing protein [Bdellovibrio sp. NC01]QDK39849.1 acetyl-CoA carboxylase biotin carboxylase subunit [Bdellovibrio sp. NC01]
MPVKFTRIAIANRGEVAVRIIKACEELGIETVLLHSEADINSRAYRMATKTICIGPAPTAESYLNIQANINGALAGGAQAIHPGFGFLSENADFAEAVEKAGITFIGPSAEAIRSLGDKVHCKELAKKAGLPLVPGYQGEHQDVPHLIEQVKKIGLPVIVKAAAGGGGRGMKLITKIEDAAELIESAQREAQSAFGSPKVFLEKYLDRAKHIEFQVFGDSTGQVIHFFDRECSVQRRHQKIIEEATSPSLTDDLRRRMGEAACAIATLGKYKGAGTVEFLLQDGEFYLLEVNTRLQVEHPVTEEVLGVDLVKMQILTAQGDFVHDPKQVRVPRGHSIECRIYAENPFMGGVPSTGLLGHVAWPEGPGRRYEYGFDEGDTITPFYDPMIAKVIVWDENRPRAIQKMIRVLKDSVVFGVHTNIPYLIEILSHKEFVMGTMTTRFIETYFAEALKEPELTEVEKKIAAGALAQVRGVATAEGSAAMTAGVSSPWSSFWRGV